MSHPNAKLQENIRVMTACGASPKAISLELNVPLEVITTHYSADMDIGLDIANARVAKVFFDLATSGEHPNATIKWAELRGGWTPTLNQNITTDEDAELARDKLLKLLNRPQTAITPKLTRAK